MKLNNNNIVERYQQYLNSPEAKKVPIKNTLSMQGKLRYDTFTPKKDVFKDTPARYLGFTNELGAAFSHLCQGAKGLLGKIPVLSWIPAIGYISLDVADKYQKGENGTGKKKIRSGASELCTQMLQSVALPTVVIKGVQTTGKKLCDNIAKNPAFKSSGKWGKVITTGASLAALFATIKPIDKLTENVMDKIINPILGLNKNKENENILADESAEVNSLDDTEYTVTQKCENDASNYENEEGLF